MRGGRLCRNSFVTILEVELESHSNHHSRVHGAGCGMDYLEVRGDVGSRSYCEVVERFKSILKLIGRPAQDASGLQRR